MRGGTHVEVEALPGDVAKIADVGPHVDRAGVGDGAVHER